MSEMHSAGFGWYPPGIIISASGATSDAERAAGVVHNPLGGGASFDVNWGPFAEDRYLWGIQGDIYLSNAVPPQASSIDYCKAMADVGITVTKASTNEIVLQKGVDHYDNAPTLNDHPHFFPVPWCLKAGDHLHMSAQAANAYLRSYGGSFGFNAVVIVFYALS
jgi:hypothetical protein